MAGETSCRSGVTGAPSVDSYIGSLITLISKSEIRYEGVLQSIDTEECSIGLRNVRSFGTEGRRRDGPQVPPNDKAYEYILFRGSDIKDLQVIASPAVQTPTPIISEPAIIQSHYCHPTTASTSSPTVHNVSLTGLGSNSLQVGLPQSTFPSGPPYHHGTNLNSFNTSPNVNGSDLDMPMYHQAFYGTPNGLPQSSRPSLLQQFPGLSIPPMQQMQFSNFISSTPVASPGFPGSSLSKHHSSLAANPSSSASLFSTLPSLPFSLTGQPQHPMRVSLEPTNSLLSNKPSVSPILTQTPTVNFPPLATLSTHFPDFGTSSSANKPVSSLAIPPQLTIAQPVTSSSILAETSTPALVTPRQLLQSSSVVASSPQPLQNSQKDVEVVQVFSKPSSTPDAISSSTPLSPVVSEAQSTILPLPINNPTHKNGSAYQFHTYRGRGGRGSRVSRPVTKFTEDFDFTAMNEKFKKDEVWGDLGKSNTLTKDKEVNGSGCYEYDHSQEDEDVEFPKSEMKSVYHKEDFFDTLSCNTLDNDPSRRRTRYSEQMKLDTETFGDFPRSHSGRGGHGHSGRFRGDYQGGRGGRHGFSGKGTYNQFF